MRAFGKMKKRLAKKRLGFFFKYACNPMLAVPEVGKLYHDCDGFNHRAVHVKYYRRNFKRGWIVVEVTAMRDDGCNFCGCLNQFLELARTSEAIQEYHSFSGYTPGMISEQRELGWWTDKTDRLKAFIDSGGRCCDVEGLPSEGWKNAESLGC